MIIYPLNNWANVIDCSSASRASSFVFKVICSMIAATAFLWTRIEECSTNGMMCSSVCKVILLCTSPDLTQEIVPLSHYSLLVRDGVEPHFVSIQNSDTVWVLKTLRYLVRMIRNDFHNIIHHATKSNTMVQFPNGVKADPRRLFQIFFLHVFNYQQFS